MAATNVLTPYIKSLLLSPPNLTPSDLSTVLTLIFQGIPSDVQIASFLTALSFTGLHHHPDYITAAASTLLQYSNKIDLSLLPQGAKTAAHGYIDIVGTGGDGKNTFNVSSSSAIVGAGMGLNVCKHGGKASTSSSGAGDLLKCLGVELMKVNNESVPSILKTSNFCFLFAPAFHPAMSHVAPVRATLGIPTIFNILGPLINPMPLTSRIIGVYAESLGEAFAKTVYNLNQLSGITDSSTMIVWGECGLDEISPIGRTKVWMPTKTGEIESFYIEPKDFGFEEHSLSEVASGTPQENALLLTQILENKISMSHPVVEYILMNSAALAVVSGLADNWKHGVELAKLSIQSGAAMQSLTNFIDAVNQV